ncbi:MULTISPECIES: D-sedoheptulose 7-phosphate isomerase [Uliginosibacterium]|uniref:Phosphoheptose isomerase n=1 Tax=Uliginosibacterium aquaticum TaxID=2731212 RepID=A0ABX2ICA7_9RHOO|nr:MULTISPECIES: D-sedoheptulose 7-phosphate isomerase [Uliginosibacterium]MDO6386213.1 D-sedoheptulose 7-phosphate isomerase [Uliginosibacterium sp. 31-12]NSL53602.1 D-sedoheptulose 7-phosphate isomerase [Uliginosibacterium aquaticum]PLK49279.1 phosphoheptose isomerase [Uliginosibacterium sp. TH139]
MSRLLQHLQEGQELLTRVLADQALLNEVDKAGDILVACLKAGGKILSAGNGGSHCDAMHFAEELSGRYRDNRPALGALAISDPSHITCVGNDYGFEFIFSRQVEALGRAGDVFFGISTSGNSANILAAAKAAKARGMQVILLMGKDGGKMKGLADAEIIVPHFGYADRIQEIHIKFIHALIDHVEIGLGYVDAK